MGEESDNSGKTENQPSHFAGIGNTGDPYYKVEGTHLDLDTPPVAEVTPPHFAGIGNTGEPYYNIEGTHRDEGFYPDVAPAPVEHPHPAEGTAALDLKAIIAKGQKNPGADTQKFASAAERKAHGDKCLKEHGHSHIAAH